MADAPAGEAAQDTNELVTPQSLFEALQSRYGRFDVDLAASDSNKKSDIWFTKERSSLAIDWGKLGPRLNLWCNPPYSRGNQGKFVGKWPEAVSTRNKVTYLVQARVGSEWWCENVWSGRQITGDETLVLRHRGESWQLRMLYFEGIHHRLEVGFFKGRLGFWQMSPTGVLMPTEYNAEFDSALLHYGPLR